MAKQGEGDNTITITTPKIRHYGGLVSLFPRNVNLRCAIAPLFTKASLTLFQDIYFIPFYFQAVQGVSVTASGVRAIPLGLSQIVAVVVVGAIVTKTGHYVSPLLPRYVKFQC